MSVMREILTKILFNGVQNSITATTTKNTGGSGADLDKIFTHWLPEEDKHKKPWAQMTGIINSKGESGY